MIEPSRLIESTPKLLRIVRTRGKGSASEAIGPLVVLVAMLLSAACTTVSTENLDTLDASTQAFLMPPLGGGGGGAGAGGGGAGAGGVAQCGNGVCELGEDKTSCGRDCACGDLVLDDGEECDGPTPVGECRNCKFVCPKPWYRASEAGGFWWCPVVPNRAGRAVFVGVPNGQQDNSIRWPVVEDDKGDTHPHNLDKTAVIVAVEPPAPWTFFNGDWPAQNRRSERFDNRKHDAELNCAQMCGDGSVSCEWEPNYRLIPSDHAEWRARDWSQDEELGCRADEPNCCKMPEAGERHGRKEFHNIDASRYGDYLCSMMPHALDHGVSAVLSTQANANVPGQLQALALAEVKRGALCSTEGVDVPTDSATRDAYASTQGLSDTKEQRYKIANYNPDSSYEVRWAAVVTEGNTTNSNAPGKMMWRVAVGDNEVIKDCNVQRIVKRCPDDPAEAAPPGILEPNGCELTVRGNVNTTERRGASRSSSCEG
jgi:hypothetical protein